MMKHTAQWVRTRDPMIRSPAHYLWTNAPALQLYMYLHVYDVDKNVLTARNWRLYVVSNKWETRGGGGGPFITSYSSASVL